MSSWQKGKLEKNHEDIRKVIPKGVAVTNYTKEDMTLGANHINSTSRASLNGRNPYELAQLLLPSKLFKVSDLKAVKADEVMLKPSLLKRKNTFNYKSN